MKTINRKVQILWKHNPSSYELLNKDVIGDYAKKIGSGVKAVNTLLSNDEMLRYTMPTILGATPDTSTKWNELVAYYWHSLSVNISAIGKDLETGFKFDLEQISNDNSLRKGYVKTLIEKLKVKHKDGVTEDIYANYVMDEIEEQYKYRYGDPIDCAEYLLWIYCQNYKPVANKIEDIDKSPDIRFYLHSAEAADKIKKEKYKIEKDAITKWNSIITADKSDSLITNSLIILDPTNIRQLSELDTMEKQMKILDFAKSDPNRFLAVVNDKAVHTKAMIENMIFHNILRRLVQSNIIVDANDPSEVIGNTLNEAISYFNNDIHKAKVSEFEVRLKSIPK